MYIPPWPTDISSFDASGVLLCTLLVSHGNACMLYSFFHFLLNHLFLLSFVFVSDFRIALLFTTYLVTNVFKIICRYYKVSVAVAFPYQKEKTLQ